MVSDTERKVNQATIAKALGLSQNAVSRALRGEADIGPETREKVIKAAERLGYRPNRFARALVSGRTRIVGVIFPNFAGQYFVEILTALQLELMREGIQVLLCRHAPGEPDEAKEVEMLLGYRVEGLVVMPLTGTDWRELYGGLLTGGERVVFLDNRAQLPCSCSIFSDDVLGSRAAVRRLVELGHRKIALVDGKNPGFTSDLRRKGYLAGLRDSGIAPDEQLWQRYANWGEVAEQIAAFRSAHPEVTAYFCTHDTAALETIAGLSRTGARVPHDVSVIGYGDNIPYPQHLAVPLTTVSQHPDEIGHKAAQAMLMMLAGQTPPAEIVVPADLIERASTAPAPLSASK